MLVHINNEGYIVVNTYNSTNLKYLKDLLFRADVRYYENNFDDKILINDEDITWLFNEYVECEVPEDFTGSTAEYWEDSSIYAEDAHDTASAAVHLYMYLYSN